jgi:hypothetical protein
MKPEITVLINREATKHDVDKWMEDLLARIQLCVLHPHSVIQRDGTTNEEERMFEELRTTEVPLGTQDHQLQSTSCRRWVDPVDGWLNGSYGDLSCPARLNHGVLTPRRLELAPVVSVRAPQGKLRIARVVARSRLHSRVRRLVAVDFVLDSSESIRDAAWFHTRGSFSIS